MLSKNQTKYLTSLHLQKNREKERLFFVEGMKMTEELLQSSYQIHSLYATGEWLQSHPQVYAKRMPVNEVTEQELKKISALTTPQQVLALVSMPHHSLELSALKGKLTLLPDDIKDPGNLGTILRIADWFGIENIICSENTVDVYNPKVVQATMGSLFRVKVFYTDLLSFLQQNKIETKLPVYASSMKGDPVYESELKEEGLILLGSESKGIGAELMQYVNKSISIPSFSINNDHAESLNVAVAAAIICSEFRRRSQPDLSSMKQ